MGREVLCGHGWREVLVGRVTNTGHKNRERRREEEKNRGEGRMAGERKKNVSVSMLSIPEYAVIHKMLWGIDESSDPPNRDEFSPSCGEGIQRQRKN